MAIPVNTSKGIEYRLKALERLVVREGAVPGTSLGRQLCSIGILKAEGIRVPRTSLARESVVVWCLSVGEMAEPKWFFRGWTLGEALNRAEAHFARKRKQWWKVVGVE